MNRRDRYAKAIALLDEWLADESGFDEATWPKIEAALPRRFSGPVVMPVKYLNEAHNPKFRPARPRI